MSQGHSRSDSFKVNLTLFLSHRTEKYKYDAVGGVDVTSFYLLRVASVNQMSMLRQTIVLRKASYLNFKAKVLKHTDTCQATGYSITAVNRDV